MVFIYIIVAMSQVRLRLMRERAGAPPPALTMWLFPWLSYLAIAGMVGVLIAMALTASLSEELKVSLSSLALVFVAYLVLRARRRSSTDARASTD
jgi:GABA permease